MYIFSHFQRAFLLVVLYFPRLDVIEVMLFLVRKSWLLFSICDPGVSSLNPAVQMRVLQLYKEQASADKPHFSASTGCLNLPLIKKKNNF